MHIINVKMIKRNCDDFWVWMEEDEGKNIVRSAHNQSTIGAKDNSVFKSLWLLNVFLKAQILGSR